MQFGNKAINETDAKKIANELAGDASVVNERYG